MIPAFEIARLPRVIFGAGSLTRLPGLAAQYGQRALLVIGAQSLQRSPHWQPLLEGLAQAGVAYTTFRVTDEPSPDLMDAAVAELRTADIDVVLAIGGGSVLDAGKAIAGLLRVPNSVMDFLEGVGPELPYQGPAVPLIAVPTTAGTGSEATKNAVLSVRGADGFKKSFRHDKLVAEYAVLDPDLLLTCPPALIAADGMDAFTQLLESYVSLKAQPFTDALALSGLERIRDSLLTAYADPAGAAEARADLLYAAFLSGVTLAQVGLGSVHGLASPLGAFFPMPHGVVCGTLVEACTATNLQALRERAPASPALPKYAKVGRLLARNSHLSIDDAHAALLATLARWTEQLNLPRLSNYGMTAADIPNVVANSRGSSMKTNPVVLTDAEIASLLTARL